MLNVSTIPILAAAVMAPNVETRPPSHRSLHNTSELRHRSRLLRKLYGASGEKQRTSPYEQRWRGIGLRRPQLQPERFQDEKRGKYSVCIAYFYRMYSVCIAYV